MNKYTVNKLVALAASVALAGCVAPGSLTQLNGASKGAVASTQAAQNAGNLNLNVHWPQKGARQTQDIPDRAEKVVVTLKDKNGGLLNQGEAGRSPNYNRIDTYSSNFNWTLTQQEGVQVKAELFDAAGVSLGRAERTIDVIAGFNAHVALDIVVDGAPTVTSVSATTLRIGDKVTIKGTGFGLSKQLWASVYLESEGTFSNEYSPFPYQYDWMVTLPPTAVKVISDTELEVTIPEQADYGPLTQRLWNYFHGDDTQKLYLGVVVDGVNSNRTAIAMPKVASASATVTLQQGTDAPVHAQDGPSLIELASESFHVPIASGSQWTYRVTDDWGGPYSVPQTSTYTVRLTDNNGQAEIKNSYGGQWNYDYLPEWPQGDFWELPFLFRLQGAGSIQNVGQEEVMLPSGYQKLATHFFYNLPQYMGPSNMQEGYMASGTFRDVWVVPGLGVVRAVDTHLEKYQYDQTTRRVTRSYDMTGFQPVGATTVN